MSIAALLAPGHLSRYHGLLRLIIQHGGMPLLDRAGLGEIAATLLLQNKDKIEAKRDAQPLAFARDLEKLGPTYVKLGQILAGQADLLPRPYTEALSRLQDDVSPLPFDQIKRVIEETLGRPVAELFATLETEPLGSASLAQVHRATLHDGSDVVVKVQRPGVRKVLDQDLDALDTLAELVDRHSELGRQYRFSRILRQLRRSLDSELDYDRESANMVKLAEDLADFKNLVIPKPYASHSGTRVLTMQRLDGRSVDKPPAPGSPRTSGSAPHAAAEPCLDGEAAGTPAPAPAPGNPPEDDAHNAALLNELFHAYLHQLLVSGTFHGDPHPGNVMRLRDGRLGLIDFGQCGFVEPKLRQGLLRLLLAVSESRMIQAADLAVDLGYRTDQFDPPGFRQRLSESLAAHQTSDASRLQAGRLVAAICRTAGQSGLDVPESITLLGKMLLHLDHVAVCLSDNFDTHAAIRRHAPSLATRQMLDGASGSRVLSGALATKDFMENLPIRVSRVLDVLADNALRVEVDALDEDRLIAGLKNIANRVAVGLVLAALIVAGGLMWGHGGWGAIAAFSGAALLALLFYGQVWWSDFADRHRPKP